MKVECVPQMEMRKVIYPTVLTIIVTFGTSCSLQKNKGIGESAVAKFHTQFNAEQYHAIYFQTDDGFRKVTREEQLTEYLKAVRRKLGEVKDTKQLSWRMNATADGTQVFLAHKTTYAEGDATEQFIFFVSDDNARLF